MPYKETPAGPPYAEAVIDFRPMFAFMRRYLPAGLMGCMAGALGGLAVAHMLPRSYKSSALMEIVPTSAREMLEPLAGHGLRNDALSAQNSFATHKAIILSSRVIGKAREKLFDRYPAEIAGGVAFDVESIKATNLLSINAVAKNEAVAAAAANILTEVTIQFLTDLGLEHLQKGRSILWDQYRESRNKMGDLESQIGAIEPFLDLKKTELKIAISQLERYQKEFSENLPVLNESKIRLPLLEKEIANYQKLEPGLSSDAAPSVSINREGKTNEQTIHIINYSVNPLYKNLEEEILRLRITNSALQPKQNQLETLIGETNVKIKELQAEVNQKTGELNVLRRELDAVAQKYQLLHGKASEAEIASSLRLGDLRLISPATETQLLSRVKDFTAGGAVLGVFAVLAFIVFFTRPAEHSREAPSFPRKRESGNLQGLDPRSRGVDEPTVEQGLALSSLTTSLVPEKKI